MEIFPVWWVELGIGIGYPFRLDLLVHSPLNQHTSFDDGLSIHCCYRHYFLDKTVLEKLDQIENIRYHHQTLSSFVFLVSLSSAFIDESWVSYWRSTTGCQTGSDTAVISKWFIVHVHVCKCFLRKSVNALEPCPRKVYFSWIQFKFVDFNEVLQRIQIYVHTCAMWVFSCFGRLW